MTMRRSALIFMLTVSGASQAQEVRTWHFSGADLIAAMEGTMPSEIRNASLSRQFSSAYAQAYVSGIADQTQGTVWCTRTGVLPHELKDRVHSYLTTLPDSRVNGNAGPLVGEALAKSFPCR